MARGALAFFENDLEAAFALIDEARVLAEEAEIAPRNPSIRINLGAIAMANHDLEESRKQHVLGIEESSEPGVLAMHYGALAEIEVRSGNLREAWDWLQKTWELCGSLGHVLVMISAMAIKVELLLKLNRPTEAARLMGAADQLRVSRGWAINVYSEPEYRGLLEACRSALTPSEFDTLMTEGRGMSGAETDAMMREDPFAGTPVTMAEEQTSANRRNLTSRETRGSPGAGRRQDQSGNCRRALHLRADRANPCRPHPAEARGAVSQRGGGRGRAGSDHFMTAATDGEQFADALSEPGPVGDGLPNELDRDGTGGDRNRLKPNFVISEENDLPVPGDYGLQDRGIGMNQRPRS